MVATNKRVLVVDDEDIVCESYKRVLSDAGYSVCTANSGRGAVAACRDQPFDVMLADLKMPDMDGLEVTRAVKERLPRLQVLIITGYPTDQSAKEARALGVFDYLYKPLTPEHLSEVTAAALASPAKPTAPVVQSEEPVSEQTLLPDAPSAELEEVVVEVAVTAAPEGTLKTLGMLAVAPLIGLAYVMLLPIIGFGVLFAVLGTGLAKKLGGTKTSSLSQN
jgi:CheY-like chemotaxis protein